MLSFEVMITTAPSGLADSPYPYRDQFIDCPPPDEVPSAQFAEVLPVQEAKEE